MVPPNRSIVRRLLIAILATGLTLVFTQLPFFSSLELKGLDLLFVLRGAQPAPSQIVIVAIDELSMAEIKRQWPWPRGLHAHLIRQLHQAKAKVIGLDVLFAEPSDVDEDAELEQAMREAGNVVLASALNVVTDPLFRLTSRTEPLPALARVARVGNPIITLEADGVVRRSRLLSDDWATFALQVAGAYLAATGRELLTHHDFYRETVIDYRGPARTIQTVSYYQALDYERLLPPGIFENKIVLVGRSLETMPEAQRLAGDTFFTPFSWMSGSTTAGVEIQANLISNLLEGSFVREITRPAQMLLLLAITWATSFVLVAFRPLWGLSIMMLLMGVLFLAATLLFNFFSLWIPFVGGVIAIGLVYGGHLLGYSLRMERERRRELEEANRHLEARITERTQTLVNVNQELENRNRQLETAYKNLAQTQEQLIHSEKMASLGLLVAGIAHELNNPISYVHSNLEFIEEYTDRLLKLIFAYSQSAPMNAGPHGEVDPLKETSKFDALEKTLKELIVSCKAGAERVKQIVLDLRTFSRTDDPGLAVADLHNGIESSLSLLTREYKNRIRIERQYDEQLPLVECHAGQINQVFMNLLLNAAQSIPEKGQVWIKTESLGERVRIVIKDNGAGIGESDLDRIFDPFFTTKSIGQGTGLGLSISYGIIEKHGGKITVKSKLGEGSEFTVELPVRGQRDAP